MQCHTCFEAKEQVYLLHSVCCDIQVAPWP